MAYLCIGLRVHHATSRTQPGQHMTLLIMPIGGPWIELTTVDPALYNEAFTGLAKSISHCCYCQATLTIHRSLRLLQRSTGGRGGGKQNQDRNHAIRAVEICRLLTSLLPTKAMQIQVLPIRSSMQQVSEGCTSISRVGQLPAT